MLQTLLLHRGIFLFSKFQGLICTDTFCTSLALVLTIPFHVGGIVEVIDSRQHIITASMNDILLVISQCPDKYCFYTVLGEPDKHAFLIEFEHRPRLHLDVYKRRAIPLSDWIDILQTINLVNRYCVYRKAYLGENAGRRSIRKDNLTNYLVKFYDLGPLTEETVYEMFSRLFIRSDTGTSNKINILLDHNHLSRLEGKHLLSSWRNPEYTMEDEYYGL